MSTERYKASELSSEAQRFLFACVYWLTAADENITGEEQSWLSDQFGAAMVNQFLAEFVDLDSAGFYAAFDASLAAVGDDEKDRIYPGLEGWLADCAISDGAVAQGEEEIWEEIKARIGYEAEVPWRGAPADSADDAIEGPPPEPIDVAPDAAQDYVVLEGHTDEVAGVAFSPDGTEIASASQDMTVRIWRAATGEEIRSLDAGDASLTAVAFGTSSLFCADRMGRILAMNLEGQSAWNIKLDRCGGITALALSADGQSLAAATETGRVVIFSALDGVEQRALGKRHTGIAHAVAWHPDGVQILVGDDDRTARIWDARSGDCVRELAEHGEGVTGVAWDASGERIATSARNNIVYLWDAQTGAAQQQLEGHDFIASGVCFGPAGAVVSISWDHTLKIWDVAAGTVKTSVENIDGRFNAVAYHAGAGCIAAGCSDNSIYLIRD